MDFDLGGEDPSPAPDDKPAVAGRSGPRQAGVGIRVKAFKKADAPADSRGEVLFETGDTLQSVRLTASPVADSLTATGQKPDRPPRKPTPSRRGVAAAARCS